MDQARARHDLLLLSKYSHEDLKNVTRFVDIERKRPFIRQFERPQILRIVQYYKSPLGMARLSYEQGKAEKDDAGLKPSQEFIFCFHNYFMGGTNLSECT